MPLRPASIDKIRAAAERIRGYALRAPLVRLNVYDAPCEVFLKLENLQPSGAFKMRGAFNKVLSASNDELSKGIWTVSSGNMAVAVSYVAREMGLDCTVLVSDDAPAKKFAAVEALGGNTVPITWETLLEVAGTRKYPGMDGLFIHPFADQEVMAGNGTIGLEIFEDLPDVNAVTVPYGGGGFAAGVASGIKALRPEAKVYAAEIESGAPFAASYAAGEPTPVDQRNTWVSGISTPYVFEDVWPVVYKLLDGSVVSSLPEVAAAVKIIAEANHVIAEGAGAAAVAPALAGKAGTGKVVCVVSGGNIDTEKLVTILEGKVPE
jgi:threonine dehydratase